MYPTVLFGFLIHYVYGISMTSIAVFLILLVLVQRGRGGGLAGAFGGMGGQSAFGTKAGDTFTRITIGASLIWILLCISSVKLLSYSADEVVSGGVTQPPSGAPLAPGGTTSPPADSGSESTEAEAVSPAETSGEQLPSSETTQAEIEAPPSSDTESTPPAPPETSEEPVETP